MRIFKLRRTRTRVHHTQRYPMYAALAAIVMLAGALTVVSIVKGRHESQLALGRRQLATQIQSNLNGAMLAIEKISLPGANIEGDILPSMRLNLYAADELNRVMIDTYGADSSMIDEQLFSQVELALTQIARGITEGISTTSAQDALKTYMAQMESDLNTRFAGSELLISRGSLK